MKPFSIRTTNSGARSIPVILVNLISSLLMVVALIGLSSCGKDSGPAIILHPAEQMPDRSVPAPSGEPALTGESQPTSAVLPEKASGPACQTAVVPGANQDHLCCSPDLSPAGSPTCSVKWESTLTQCSLSFQRAPGVLWSCGPQVKVDLLDDQADSQDEILSRSASSEDFRLHHTAEGLGNMDQGKYLDLQNFYLKSKEPACNYFLITALCQAGHCKTDMPWYRAAEFDTYFRKQGWQLLTLDQLKAWFVAGIAFDSVLQKDGVSSSKPGHVAIPVGLGYRDRLYIAQGSLGTVTNEVKSVGDGFVLEWAGGFRIFAKTKR